MEHAQINENNEYICPVCGAKFKYIYNYHYDGSYRLQCPNDREHCTIISNVTEQTIDLFQYEPLQDIIRCDKCSFVLSYDEENNSLVCPVDTSHMPPIKIPKHKANLLGYRPYDPFDDTAKEAYKKAQQNK